MSTVDDPLAELEEARVEYGLNPNGSFNGSEAAGYASVAERAETYSDEELFPLGSLEGDPKTTLKTLIAAGMRTEVTVSLRAAEVPVRNNGLFSPEATGSVLVSFQPEKVELVAKRDRDSGKITQWKVRQVLRPTYVQDGAAVYTREQVLDMLEQVGVPANSAKVTELLGE